MTLQISHGISHRSGTAVVCLGTPRLPYCLLGPCFCSQGGLSGVHARAAFWSFISSSFCSLFSPHPSLNCPPYTGLPSYPLAPKAPITLLSYPVRGCHCILPPCPCPYNDHLQHGANSSVHNQCRALALLCLSTALSRSSLLPALEVFFA